MTFDWSTMRVMMIKVLRIRRAEDKFAFSYDETNNIRKFRLIDEGTNVAEHKNFVLGGIVLQEEQALPETVSLRTALGMQDNAVEIKFKHVARGDFEAVLASCKMARFLAWLIERQLAIHYLSINIVYWSIVDIVDSILANKRIDTFNLGQREMKNELYRIACMDKTSFLALMKHHGYTNIQRGKVADFIAHVALCQLSALYLRLQCRLLTQPRLSPDELYSDPTDFICSSQTTMSFRSISLLTDTLVYDFNCAE